MRMKPMKLLALFLMGAFSLFSCGGCGSDDPAPGTQPGTGTDPEPDDPTTVVTGFAKGADISWVTEMENEGKLFYNAAGTATDCFTLMKELGMNAIRLRVWVNPENEYGAWCDKADVLAKARRAKAAGLDLMIDFHYSDMFADPGRQNTPQAWANKSLGELQTAVADHTKDVLTALKNDGITPKWVQVGNETRVGMLWPTGQLWTSSGDVPNGWQNYVALSNAGYEAVKAVFSDAIVIIHIDNAWDDQNWWFDKFKQLGGKMDMIGLSHYPQTHDTKSWSDMNTLAINHIAAWGKTYGVKVMVCEVGVKSDANASLAAQVLTDFMTRAKSVEQCAGVFYWEPQVYNGWRPSVYAQWGWGAYDMGAFTKDGKPAAAMDAFK